MAGVLNRTEDSSLQRQVYRVNAGAVATGVTGIIAQVETPCVLEAGQVAAFGLSGAPTYQIMVNRFVVGAGATAFAVTAASAPPAYGTSGVIAVGLSLLASGNTLLNLMPNDVLMYISAVANTAVTGLSVNLVVRPIQDVKKYFGTLA